MKKFLEKNKKKEKLEKRNLSSEENETKELPMPEGHLVPTNK